MSAQREGKPSANVYFPESFSVLVVDADSVSLDKITEMCQRCSYEVTATTNAMEALSILREDRNKFDIVIIDINIHDIDPFKFIKTVSEDTNQLPLVVVSGDQSNETMVKAFNSGASDVLLKPILIDNIKIIWKNILRNQNCKMGQSKTEPSIEDCQRLPTLLDSDIVNPIDYRNVISESSSSSIVAKDDEDTHKKEITQKKQRRVWTPQLHAKFVAIVDQIGVKSAVPKKILEMMNEPSLTRENVASHLQKFRLYLRKSEESKQQKRQMQSQAMNLEFNAQTYSYNSQNEIVLDLSEYQHLVQIPTNSFVCIPPLSQISPDNFSQAEPIFGVQTDNNISSSSTFVNEFSNIRVGETDDLETSNNSFLQLRAKKIQKMSHDVSNENLTDEYWRSDRTTDNDSSRLSSSFGENTSSLQNSGRYTAT